MSATASQSPGAAAGLRASQALSRADFHAADGVLLVVRNPPPPPPAMAGQPPLIAGNPAEGVEVLLAVWDDGSATGLCGHVDLGTGIRTALAQVMAEELDQPLAQFHMVLGDTRRAPNQGATIASASLQIHAQPLRQAAAQARAWLLAQAAARWQVALDALQTQDGAVSLRANPLQRLTYGELVAGQHAELLLDPQVPLKPAADYRLVGQSIPRVDIPAKVMGDRVFVHDMRMPGMLHGRVVRPPYAGADHGDFIGNTLASVDQQSIAHIPGIRAVVVQRDFVGVVAEREEQAEQALRELRVLWKPWPGMPDVQDLQQALRDNPATVRQLVNEGNVDAALAGAAQPMPRTYVWPYQMHASIGPSCAVAHWSPDGDDSEGGRTAAGPLPRRAAAPSGGSDPHEVGERGGMRLRVWAGTQNPHVLRADLALLLGVPDVSVDVVRMEAAGCYGRNGADDVAADAALLSRAVGAPVRVQLTREQEHLWEPKGAAQLMEVQGGLNADGSVAAYDFQTSYPSNGAPTLALLLTRTVEPVAQSFEMGDRTARPPYAFDHLRVAVKDMPPIVRASWLRGVSALPNSFAHESYIDELATAAGVDPVAFRLRYLKDPRAVDLVQATAKKAGWTPHTQPRQTVPGNGQEAGGGQGSAQGEFLSGQGFAYARYIHSKWPGFGAAWAAWVADVDVNRRTGEVHVRRVVVGHDAGLVVNPAGVEHQVHGNVLQTTSRALKEKVQFTPGSNVVANQEWGSYPILSFREVPVIEVLHMPRPGEPALGAGESASVPGTAAIANAIFDATGVRLREPPFTPEVVRAALADKGLLMAPSAPLPDADRPQPVAPVSINPPELPADAPWPRRRSWWARAGALALGALGFAAVLVGWRPAIAPVSLSTASSAQAYSPALLARGRQLAAAGDCAVCHTTEGGITNAGGRAMETPFGTLYTTNLTPDVATGIGAWSFSAFQRAMREGISRDGKHLYPAFPYTAFAKTSDDDLMALYAYLMAQPAVAAPTPPAQLRFPFSYRPLMAGWNALFHDPAPYQPDPARSAEWNRGAYLVNGLGHCGACHTPRNALGAEQGGRAYLAGALVDGWEAPALTALSKAPVPWSAEELYRYLRHGHTREHGSASGPMALVVQALGEVPDEDVRAMAAYLASFQSPGLDSATQKAVDEVANVLFAGSSGEAAARASMGRIIAGTRSAEAVVQQAAQAANLSSLTLLGTGQRLFNGACASCHHDGDGPRLLGVNIPLALNSNLHSDRPDNLLRVILEGIQEPAAKDIGFMPAFRHSLSDAQIAELAGYMRQRYAPGKRAWEDMAAAVGRVRAAASAH